MSNEEVPSRRVLTLAAQGVLGEHDHRVDFGSPDDFAIVFGPNGVGKTRFLEIIEALANLRTDLLATLPFNSAEIEFSDRTRLRVTHKLAATDAALDTQLFEYTTAIGNRLGGSRRRRGKSDPVPALEFEIVTDGSTLTAPPIAISDVIEREALPLSIRRDRLPPSVRREFERISMHGSLAEGRAFLRQWEASHAGLGLPEEFAAFVDSLDLRLIATQRLLTMDLEANLAGSKRETTTPRATIEQHSETVRRRLAADLSENSRLSQRLDSTFPRLMLERREQSTMTEESIRERLRAQGERRARIQQITPLGIEHELPLPEEELTPGQRSVLELYAEHAELKLATFADTVEKVDLFETIVNSRLYGKRLSIDAERGITIIRLSDGERIPLIALSSGEQHEVILMFDLLFNVKPGGLVLIDEPEISLHIAWQKRFIPDVLRIAKLVGFQFVIATHSPQIIDGNWRYAQRLGPRTEIFDEDDEDA